MGMTSDIKSAYKSAKKEYTSMLPALQTRYQDLYTQLGNEQRVAQGQNVALSGVEQTSLKSTLAKRGLDVNADNPYFATEANKLTGNQNLRAEATDVQYAGQRANTALDETKSMLTVKSALADLAVSKSRDLTAAKQWKKTFDFTKSEAEANRALEIYKAAKSSAGSGSKTGDKYKSALASMVASTYSGELGSQQGLRENIRDTLLAQFPEYEKQIQTDVYDKFFPAGFESRIPQTKNSSSIAPEVQKVMDALGVDQATATKMIQTELGL